MEELVNRTSVGNFEKGLSVSRSRVQPVSAISDRIELSSELGIV